MARGSSPRRAAWTIVFTVLGVELKRLLRDRRALASAILLPALLYPVLFQAHSYFARLSHDDTEAALVRVLVDLRTADPELGAAIAQSLESEIPIRVVPVGRADLAAITSELAQLAEAVRAHESQAEVEERALVQQVLEQGYDALVSALPDPVLAGRSVLRVHHDASDGLSVEAFRRVERALASVREEHELRTLKGLLGTDPASSFLHTSVNIASSTESNDAALARLLPLLAVLVLVAGGSFAALSTFAGEREGGTLETLLVQPVPALTIAWGKFLAVFALALVALLSNVGSVLGSLGLGLGTLPGMVAGSAGESSTVLPSASRLLLASALFLPTALLVCALLALNSARARTFREGQQVLLPLSILMLVPAGLAAATHLELDALTALVPLLGASLALRDAIRGSLAFGPGALAVLASCAWAWWVLLHLARTLDAERILQTQGSEDEVAERHVQSRTALGYGLLAVAVTYLIGGWLQSWRAVPGLLLTLWVLFPLLAFAALRPIARRAGETLRQALWLHWPDPRHVLGAALLAPAVARVTRALVEFQQTWAPLPSSFARASEAAFSPDELSGAVVIFVFAISPGICEELLFRGALLSGMRRDLPAWRVVLLQGALFGAAHASIYRLLPTASVGALLALVTLRTRCLLPAVVLHVAYDSLLVGSLRAEWLLDPQLAWLALPGLALLGRHRQRREHALQAPMPATS